MYLGEGIQEDSVIMRYGSREENIPSRRTRWGFGVMVMADRPSCFDVHCVITRLGLIPPAEENPQNFAWAYLITK